MRTNSGAEEQSAGVILDVTLTTESTINVTATITGNTRQIAEYDFILNMDIWTSERTVATRKIDIDKTDGRKCDFTYRSYVNNRGESKGLAPNTSFKVKVIARDIYGTEYTSTEKTATTTYNNYVKPIDKIDQTRTGMTVDYMPEEDAGWAIWGEDENYLYLISRDAKNVSLTGVGSLKNTLNTLDTTAQSYVDKNYTGILARSIREEDLKETSPYYFGKEIYTLNESESKGFAFSSNYVSATIANAYDDVKDRLIWRTLIPPEWNIPEGWSDASTYEINNTNYRYIDWNGDLPDGSQRWYRKVVLNNAKYRANSSKLMQNFIGESRTWLPIRGIQKSENSIVESVTFVNRSGVTVTIEIINYSIDGGGTGVEHGLYTWTGNETKFLPLTKLKTLALSKACNITMQSGEEITAENALRCILSIPKQNYNLAEGGINGEDYHISSVDQELAEQVTATYQEITPTDFSKTGATIDYKPTGGENKIVEINAIDIGKTGTAITFSKTDEILEWKIWGEDADNIYIISSEPTAKKLPLSRSKWI